MAIITIRTALPGDRHRARPQTATAAATELMNRIYRRQRHIYDITRKWFLLGRDRLIEELRPRAGDAVLEIGCGTGRNLVLAARRYPQARFFGIDVSTGMLTTAIEAIGRAGLSPRVRVAHGDAVAFDPERLFGCRRFARIMISYSLSMIEAWPASLDTAFALLAEGGRLHIVDFGRQEGWPALFRGLLRGWLARFHVAPPDALEAEIRSRAAQAGANIAIERPYRGYVVYVVVEARR